MPETPTTTRRDEAVAEMLDGFPKVRTLVGTAPNTRWAFDILMNAEGYVSDLVQELEQAEASLSSLRAALERIRAFALEQAHPQGYGITDAFTQGDHWSQSCNHCELMAAFGMMVDDALSPTPDTEPSGPPREELSG